MHFFDSFVPFYFYYFLHSKSIFGGSFIVTIHALFEAKIVIVITIAPLKMHLLNHTPLFWHLLHLPFLLQRLAFVLALTLDVMFALAQESYL